AAFPIRGGGTCSGGTVRVWTCEVIGLGTRTVASTDQNADLVVDGTDEALVEAKVGTADASADFDCDGLVTSADVNIIRAHLGHHAPGPLSAPPPIAPALYLAASPNPALGQVSVSFSLSSAGP